MDVLALRYELRRRLPSQVFEPQWDRGVVALLTVPLLLAIGAAVVLLRPGHLASLGVAIVMSQLVARLAFAAHEAAHGQVFRSRLWRDVLISIGVAPFLGVPSIWEAWHGRHHAHTQHTERDPDHTGMLWLNHTSWLFRWRSRLFLGSRRLSGILGMPFLFTLQGLLTVWVYPGTERSGLTSERLTRARVASATMIVLWAALLLALGWRDAFYVVLLPVRLAEATIMAYIETQHNLEASRDGGRNDPLQNTLSVATHPWLDWLHLEFSYHQEHHLFPTVSHRFGPMIRRAMAELQPGSVRVAPHGAALAAVFNTPRSYADHVTLAELDGGGRVKVTEVQARLQSSSTRSSMPLTVELATASPPR